jgi:hypothetical protein
VVGLLHDRARWKPKSRTSPLLLRFLRGSAPRTCRERRLSPLPAAWLQADSGLMRLRPAQSRDRVRGDAPRNPQWVRAGGPRSATWACCAAPARQPRGEESRGAGQVSYLKEIKPLLQQQTNMTLLEATGTLSAAGARPRHAHRSCCAAARRRRTRASRGRAVWDPRLQDDVTPDGRDGV